MFSRINVTSQNTRRRTKAVQRSGEVGAPQPEERRAVLERSLPRGILFSIRAGQCDRDARSTRAISKSGEGTDGSGAKEFAFLIWSNCIIIIVPIRRIVPVRMIAVVRVRVRIAQPQYGTNPSSTDTQIRRPSCRLPQ